MILFFAFMAAALIVIGIVVSSRSKKGYVETTATIVELVEYSAGEDVTYEVFVNYTVDGVLYEHVELNSYSGSLQEGKEITILYDPSNPSKIVGKSSSWLPILLFAGGALFAAIAVVVIVNTVRSIKKAKAIAEKPTIEDTGRTMGEPEKLFFAWDTSTHVKLRFYLEDANKVLLYEGKMTKFNVIGAYTYLFRDILRHKEEEHKVGHENSAGSENTTVSSGFTFDGVEMTEYLDANRITVNYGVGSGVSMAYDIFFNGKKIAHAETTSRYMHEDEAAAHPIASKFRLNQYFYEVEGQREYADIIFLALFKEAQTPRLSSLMG